MKPGQCKSHLVTNAVNGVREELGDLLCGHAAKKAKLYQRLLRLSMFSSAFSASSSATTSSLCAGLLSAMVSETRMASPASFLSPPGDRLIHQDPAHDL